MADVKQNSTTFSPLLSKECLLQSEGMVCEAEWDEHRGKRNLRVCVCMSEGQDAFNRGQTKT